MRNKLYFTISALILLPSCFFNNNNKQKGAKHTFFIQATLDSTVIKNIQNAIRPLVNNIIAQELAVVQDFFSTIFTCNIASLLMEEAQDEMNEILD